MKRYKVYIQAYHEAIVEAESEEQARMEVCDNLSDYFVDAMIQDCVVGNAVEIKENKSEGEKE